MVKQQAKRVSMSGEDLKRLRIINEYISKKLTRSEASEKLNLTARQVTRLKNKIIQKGDQSIVHGMLGKASNNKTAEVEKEKILNLYKSKYEPCGFNFTHLSEKLLELENIDVSRETLRSWIRFAGLSDRRIKRGRKHRSRRERRARIGELLQLDTSPHDWFGIGEKQHLVVIVDDATTNILYARLFERDGSLPNLQVLDYVFRKYGLPLSIYTDKASWFHYSEQGVKVQNTFKALRKLHEQDVETQIQRALKKVGVEMIAAHSPQAKGRVERMNGILQDRLIPEFKLQKITTIAEGNQFLEYVFLPKHNKQFQVKPASDESAFVPLANPNVLEEIMCVEFENRVLNDNTISRANRYLIQLLPTKLRQSWVRAKVIVRIKIDGSVVVRHGETNELIPNQIKMLKLPHESKHKSRELDQKNGTF